MLNTDIPSQPKTHGAANVNQEVIGAITSNLEPLLNNLRICKRRNKGNFMSNKTR